MSFTNNDDDKQSSVVSGAYKHRTPKNNTSDEYLEIDRYYKYIREGQGTKTPKKYFEIPSNITQIIVEVDNKNVSFKKQFIVVSVLLHELLKKNNQEKNKNCFSDDVSRDENSSRKRKHSSCSDNDADNVLFNTSSKMSKTEACLYGKVKTRHSVVPLEMFKCKSQGVRMAVAMFCLHDYKKDINTKVFIAIHNEKFKTVEDIILLSSKPVVDINAALRDCNVNAFKELDYNFRKRTVINIMEVSDMIRDKSVSYCALNLDYTLYLDMAIIAANKNIYNSVNPYYAFINMYIKKCIALCEQKKKVKEIFEQFNVNATDTMMLILGNLKCMIDSEIKNAQCIADSKIMRFEPEIVYQVFRGPPHFERHVSVSCKYVGNDIVMSKYFKNCLFDVIGTKNLGLFHDKTWMERLDSVNITPKVLISECLGKDLNNINENVSLGVSWMDNGCSAYKTFNIVKNRKK